MCWGSDESDYVMTIHLQVILNFQLFLFDFFTGPLLKADFHKAKWSTNLAENAH